jgi:hypothetical protein
MLNAPEILAYFRTLHVKGRDHVSALIAVKMPAMIQKYKDFFTKFLTPAKRTPTANKEIFSMIIHTANMDSRWKSLLHNSLSTAKTNSSVHSLAAQLKITQIDTRKNTKMSKNNQHNILKAARQISHLKTSQIENSQKAVKKQIRIHSIYTIKTDDKLDFRTMDDAKQEKEIQAILQLQEKIQKQAQSTFLNQEQDPSNLNPSH